MRKARLAAILLFFPTSVLAEEPPTKARPAQTTQSVMLQADIHPFGIVQHDLFDRNNPNNGRPDHQAPPVQPGQF